MAYTHPLPEPFNSQGWKVKIRDRERVEPPHITLIRSTTAWRFGLRELDFLDKKPDPKGVPPSLVEYVKERNVHAQLVAEWDRMYPENPVSGGDDNGE